MGLDETKEICGRCGTGVYPFSRKYSVSNSAFYCIKCAETLDKDYLAKNSCSVCARLISSSETKFVFPSRAYGNERLVLSDRLVCAGCNSKMLQRKRAPSPQAANKASRFRFGIRRAFVRKMLANSRILE